MRTTLRLPAKPRVTLEQLADLIGPPAPQPPTFEVALLATLRSLTPQQRLALVEPLGASTVAGDLLVALAQLSQNAERGAQA